MASTAIILRMDKAGRHIILFFFTLILAAIACYQKDHLSFPCLPDQDALFTLQAPDKTGIDFQNDLSYSEEFNTYTYRNFYNGGGVAIGDLNNDGLSDVFFCGNMVSNRLYLNQGDFQFQDVTRQSGLETNGVWSTGVSFADINGDGWLDIYVCKSGKPEGEKRYNELFINQGIAPGNDYPTFKEEAAKYGIDDYGLSTHAAFLDYDKDGDLDMYLLNNSLRSIGQYDLRPGQRLLPDPHGGNKLYRNDGSEFTDVTTAAGIYSSAIGFGLGVSVGDINRDGWPDLFVSNDFFEKDYLYLNNQDGTFTESLEALIGEISLGSMGADMADLTNDGFPEIFVTEMLPENERRLKTKTIFENWDKYQTNLAAGYYRQFPRNVLQLNSGYIDNGGNISMREISRFAGVEATDWSWGALIADLDNDGYKDLFVANGIYKDLTDLDYINFYTDPATTQRLFKERGQFLKHLIDSMPSKPLPNYLYQNNGDLTFTNKAPDWGLNCASFSNGSAYGDLDNDGDLDLVINNVNMPPFIYRNNTDRLHDRHFLKIKLRGKGKNSFAIGTQVTLYAGGQTFYQELAPMRGYQSSVDYSLHFGLGGLNKIDSLRITWPDLSHETHRNIAIDQHLEFTQQPHRIKSTPENKPGLKIVPPLFSPSGTDLGIGSIYKKPEFIDFNRDPLIFHMLSAEGGQINTGDLNGDHLTDLVFPGAKGAPLRVYLQNRGGTFTLLEQQVFIEDQASRVISTALFDADQDGDLDLYTCSGGNEFPASSSSLVDHLYFNDGSGRFLRSPQILPTSFYENTACVKPSDFDGDGDLDLFVGIRARPFQYGLPCNAYLLENDGKGQFTDRSEQLAPGFQELGLITDAVWIDTDLDGDLDLVISGEWMSPTLFKNDSGRLVRDFSANGLNQSGLWNCIEAADLDLDGDMDLVIGNHGLNTRLKANPTHPMYMYVYDFDRNGKIEQIITTYKDGDHYPFVGRNDLVSQLPHLKKKYLKFNSFQQQTVQDIFGSEIMEKALRLAVTNTASTVFINEGNHRFSAYPLPAIVQLAPIYAIHIKDYTKDGIPDLIVGGNFHWSKPEVGIYDANRLTLLAGKGDGQFVAIDERQSGLHLEGEIRDIQPLNRNGEPGIIVSRLNETPVILKYKQ